METEENNSLPYLDMTVIRQPNQKLITEWYKKSIASGRMLNFNSCHQLKHKVNVARNFIHRVISLSRNPSNQNPKEIIHEILQMNNYPKTLINRIINLQYRNKITSSTSPSTTAPFTISPTARSQPPNIQSATARLPSPTETASPTLRNINSSTPLLPIESATSKSHQNSHTDFNTPTSSGKHHCTTHLNQHNINQIPTFHQSAVAVTRSFEQTPSCQSNNTSPIQHESQVILAAAPTNPSPSCPSHDTPTENSQLSYFSMAFVPNLTEKLGKMLQADYPSIKIASKQTNSIGNIYTNMKDPVPNDDRSKLIYSIPCKDCDHQYIGLTRQRLSDRISGHRSLMNQLDKIVNTYSNTAPMLDKLMQKSALIEHCIKSKHRFELSNTKIIDSTLRHRNLEFLEMCHIYMTKNSVNKRTDVDNLNTAYAAIFDKLYKHFEHQSKSLQNEHIEQNEQTSIDQSSNISQ